MSEAAKNATKETKPVDSDIPDGWAMGPFPAGKGPLVGDEASSPMPVSGENCWEWSTFRVTYGETRLGKVFPYGKKHLFAYYVGECKWDIIEVQSGLQNTFQVQRNAITEVKMCVDPETGRVTITEEAAGQTPDQWVKIATNSVFAEYKVHKSITAKSDPCPEGWDPSWQLPEAVSDTLREVSEGAGIPSTPVGIGPPPPPPWTGPSVGPAPTHPPHPPHPWHPHSPHTHEEDAHQRVRDYYRKLGRGRPRVVGRSDRDIKANISQIDRSKLLGQLARLPISSWNYADEPVGNQHIGPMAQDFRATFGLGSSTEIDLIDANGIALASIQELSLRVKSLENE